MTMSMKMKTTMKRMTMMTHSIEIFYKVTLDGYPVSRWRRGSDWHFRSVKYKRLRTAEELLSLLPTRSDRRLLKLIGNKYVVLEKELSNGETYQQLGFN